MVNETTNMSNEQFIELYKSFLSFVQQAVSISIVLNGGALISIMTFIGNIKKDIFLEISKDLKYASLFFVLGVILGGGSAITGYLTQYTYFKEEAYGIRPFYVSGTILRVLLLFLLSLSLAFFAFGSWLAIMSLPSKM